MPDAQKDDNNVSTVLVVSKDDLKTPVNVAVEPTTGAIIVEIS